MATQIPLSQIDRTKGAKSSLSGPNGACFMAMRRENGDVVTWNSRSDNTDTATIYTRQEWEALVGGVRAGELDWASLPVA